MTAAGWSGNPAARIEAAFRAIAAERMRGLPFVNEALEVEAIGFAPWDAHWLGCLITPWCMNLVLLPRDPAAWPSVAAGDKVAYRFPAGVYEFVAGREQAIGEFLVRIRRLVRDERIHFLRRRRQTVQVEREAAYQRASVRLGR